MKMKYMIALILAVPTIALAQAGDRLKADQLVDNVQAASNAVCGGIAKEAVIVANGASKGLPYEEAIKQQGVLHWMIPQAKPVFQAAFHGLSGMPDVEVRMQSYKMCADSAAKEAESMRRTMRDLSR